MKNRSAFTLIELLVVVLIIGILAAVALPQYQKAVLKSQYMQLVSAGHQIKEAEKIYYLTHGKYTQNFCDLDLRFPGTGGGSTLHLNDKHVCTLSETDFSCWLGLTWGATVGLHAHFATNDEKCDFFESGSKWEQYDKLCNSLSKDHVRRNWYDKRKFYYL